jgi:2,4-dienoyl-CoA reductase-like NADH-dependent reductase (Old Yellow Enzyme family)
MRGDTLLAVSLTSPLKLPCGAILTNRMAKAAITEGLADPRGWPTEELEGIYDDWGRGNFGLQITGNIIVNGDHLERPGNVVIDGRDDPEFRARLRSWSRVGTQKGSHLWAQLSHSGRQTPKFVNPRPLSSSQVKLIMPMGLFGTPKAMSPLEIEEVVWSFANAAGVCQRTGFTGVQIHAAHGYLLSAFLSPQSNTRDDAWGGSLENRSRLLLSIVRAVRAEVGRDFPVCVKLNSADFQRGGFEAAESEKVALALEREGIDLLEISGGSYEKPAMLGPEETGSIPPGARRVARSTIEREAYFMEFARALRKRVRIPIMLTGGLRSRQGMMAALSEGVDVLGVARPVCVNPYAVAQLLDGSINELENWEDRIRNSGKVLGSGSPLGLVRTLNNFANIYWFYAQIYRAGRGEAFADKLNPMLALLEVMRTERKIFGERKRMGRAQARAA